MRIRVPYPFQWGAPSFDAGKAFSMMIATFVALVESIGGFIAVSRYASATPLPPYILSRGVGWQGYDVETTMVFLLIDVKVSSNIMVGGLFKGNTLMLRSDSCCVKDLAKVCT